VGHATAKEFEDEFDRISEAPNAGFSVAEVGVVGDSIPILGGFANEEVRSHGGWAMTEGRSQTIGELFPSYRTLNPIVRSSLSPSHF
jgi:hypothetical protein